VKDIFRRVRGGLGTALVWAAGWFVAGLGLGAVLHIGFGPPIPFWPYVLNGAQNLAEMGFLMGGAFSLYVGIAGRHKRVEDLSPVRFAVGSGVIAGLLIPAYTMLVNGIAGASVPVYAVLFVAAFSAGLGGATALASIKLAQGALPSSPTPPQGLASGPERALSPSRDEVV